MRSANSDFRNCLDVAKLKGPASRYAVCQFGFSELFGRREAKGSSVTLVLSRKLGKELLWLRGFIQILTRKKPFAEFT